MSPAPRLYVLAGVNGAGKSSIGGAMFRASKADYFNPDEAACRIRAIHRQIDVPEANALAWQLGKTLLEKAIAKRLDFAFETTLGGNTMPGLIARAARSGFEVNVWYAGLVSVEAHLARVKARVARGGHDIPEVDIRRRWNGSRRNLIMLMPLFTGLRAFDNSEEADPTRGKAPEPRLVLHLARGRIVGPEDLTCTPGWAKPIVAAALRVPGE
jgi:predicted ABC-type ATPase